MRCWSKGLVGIILSLVVGTVSAGETLRVGLTPAFLHDRHGLLAEWKSYMEKQLGRPVEFVLRDSYSDTMNLIRQGRLDTAWLCDYPYVLMKPHVRLLSTPIYRGRPYYRSYLIVPARDARTRDIRDLKGKAFAYADPYSNTGFLAPRFEIIQSGADPDRFFRRTFFTWSHRKAIEAVAAGLADGAAVDSYVWESLEKVEPDLIRRTRIVTRSPEYGFPPFVTVRTMPEKDFLALQRALMDMGRDATGRDLLAKMHLDGFAKPNRDLYTDVEEMVRRVDGRPDAVF